MINKVTLVGHLGGDPEIRTLENGSTVGRFSLATNESYKDKEGNWQNKTEWHNVILWRDLAERAKILKKGSTVYVEGKISYRKYTDKDGVEKSLTDIVAERFRSLDKRESGQENQAQAQTTDSEAPAYPDQRDNNGDSDDLPF